MVKGNVTQSTVSTYAGNVGNGTPHQVVTTNTYAATDVANWTLARLTRAVVDKTLPDGNSTRRVSAFEYDGKGLLRAETIEPDNASLSLRTQYARDLFGNLTQTTVGAGTPEARSSALGYDAKGRYPESSTNALGQVARTTYDARWGQPTRVEGLNHSAATPMVTTATYDAFGREASTTDVLGKTAEVVREWCTETLCPAARYGPRARYRVEARAADGGKSAVVYDALERAIGTETLMFDGRWSRQVTTHDPTGRVAATAAPCFDGETQHWTAYAHDELGRPIAEASDAHQDDTNGSRRIALEYGPLWVKQTDPRGKVRVTDQNAIGQVVRVRDPDGGESTFDYDPEGNLIRATDALGNVATLAYDVRGLKIRSDDPDMGVWTYTHTRFGELATQTDAKGQVVANTYDRLGRRVQRTDAQGTAAERTTTWTWDTLWQGALSAISATDGYAEALTYTAKGQLATRTQRIAAVDYTYAYVYDAWGRVQTLTYPSQFRVKQTFTASGHLQSVVDDATGAALVTVEQGDARGNTTGQVYGNGVRTLRTFDAAQGFVRGITATAADATVLHQMAFDWDLAGNLAQRQDLRRNLTETFTYDNLNRLIAAAVTGPVSSTDTFTYDALGNILTKTGVGSYTYGAGSAGPHAVTGITGTRPATFTYDANGNLLSGGGRVITWSPTNLPTDITQGSNRVQFTYAPDGQRLVQVETGRVPRTLTYAGGLYEKQVVGSSVAHRHFVRVWGETLAIVTTGASAGTQYLHRDHQGSVALLTDPAATPLEYLSYDAFGKRRNALTWAADPTDALLQTAAHQTDRGYTGHEHLDRVALIHMNGRVYDAALGRFISPDPFVPLPMSTQGLNRYSYVDNNPLRFTDPSGFFLKGLVKGLAKMAAVSKLLGPGLVVMTCTNPATAVSCGATVAGTVAGAQTAVMGGSPSDTVKAAGVSFASVHAFSAIGTHYNFAEAPVSNVVLHGVVGGVSTVVMGGQFNAGFAGGAAGAFVTPLALGAHNSVSAAAGSGTAGRAAGMMVSAIAGGTAASIAGGKFANGAVTGAFSYAFAVGSLASRGGIGGSPGSTELLTDANGNFIRSGEVGGPFVSGPYDISSEYGATRVINGQPNLHGGVDLGSVDIQVSQMKQATSAMKVEKRLASLS